MIMDDFCFVVGNTACREIQALLPTLLSVRTVYVNVPGKNGITLRREKAGKWYGYRRIPVPGAMPNAHNGAIKTKLVKRYIGKDENMTIAYVAARFGLEVTR